MKEKLFSTSSNHCGFAGLNNQGFITSKPKLLLSFGVIEFSVVVT